MWWDPDAAVFAVVVGLALGLLWHFLSNRSSARQTEARFEEFLRSHLRSQGHDEAYIDDRIVRRREHLKGGA